LKFQGFLFCLWSKIKAPQKCVGEQTDSSMESYG